MCGVRTESVRSCLSDWHVCLVVCCGVWCVQVALSLDLGARSVEFFKNGASVRKCVLNTGEVCLAICFGGSNQRVTIAVGVWVVAVG